MVPWILRLSNLVRIRRRLEGKLCSCLAKFSEAVEKRKEAVRHNDDDTTTTLLHCYFSTEE
jgi:hypothetical protein